jgi:hypothetical protein
VHRSLSNVARSVLLTSGTLSPLDSFSGELGLDFHVRLEAPHVVDVNRQVGDLKRWPGMCEDRGGGVTRLEPPHMVDVNILYGCLSFSTNWPGTCEYRGVDGVMRLGAAHVVDVNAQVGGVCLQKHMACCHSTVCTASLMVSVGKGCSICQNELRKVCALRNT